MIRQTSIRFRAVLRLPRMSRIMPRRGGGAAQQAGNVAACQLTVPLYVTDTQAMLLLPERRTGTAVNSDSLRTGTGTCCL